MGEEQREIMVKSIEMTSEVIVYLKKICKANYIKNIIILVLSIAIAVTNLYWMLKG